jgi:competence protein ComEC
VTIATIAYLLNRRHSHINSLAGAGILVLLLNPTALFSTGTQLSFLAVASLMVTPSLYDPRRNHIQESPGDPDVDAAWEYLLVPNAPHGAILKVLMRKWALGFVNLMYASFQMTVVLLPLVVKAFHVAAFIGIFMNILLWFPLMIGMMSGAGVVIFGPIPFIGSFFGWVCSASLGLMAAIIHWGSTLPGHCLWLRGTPTFWNVALYTLLGLWIVFPGLRLRARGKLSLILVLMVLLLIPFMQFGTSRKGELRCSFISVSHGLSILLQLPDGEVILYDAGQFAPGAYPARTISEFLWNSGVHRLDAIVVSHPDMDHYNAVPGILNRFPVGRILVSPQMYAVLKAQKPALSSPLSPPQNRQEEAEVQTAKMLQDLSRSISAKKVPLAMLVAGDRIPVAEDCSITVLHPTHACLEAEPERTNANSLVLLVEYEGVRILLTGDLAPPGLGYVISGPPIPCDVVQAPHHGGKTCATREFGIWSRPKYFVICDSFGNEQKLTTDIYCSLGAQVFHTGREGAVIFTVRDGKLHVVTREEWRKWH